MCPPCFLRKSLFPTLFFKIFSPVRHKKQKNRGILNSTPQILKRLCRPCRRQDDDFTPKTFADGFADVWKPIQTSKFPNAQKMSRIAVRLQLFFKKCLTNLEKSGITNKKSTYQTTWASFLHSLCLVWCFSVWLRELDLNHNFCIL